MWLPLDGRWCFVEKIGLRVFFEKSAVFTLAHMGESPFSQLTRLGDVDCIIDVGVFKGTPDLYSLFPGAHFILVDPLPDNCEIYPKSYEFVPVVLKGDSDISIFYEYDSGGASSSYQFTKLSGGYKSGLKRSFEVAAMTLDDLIESRCKSFCSIGVKIDVQGGEWDSLSEANIDDRVRWIVVENNIFDRYNHHSNASSVTALLFEKGFRFVNILSRSTPYFSSLMISYMSGPPMRFLKESL